jgi:hypothetical protein
MKRLALLLTAFLPVSFIAPMCLAAGDAKLQSPWDNRPVALTGAPYNCPELPALTKTIDAEGYYIDANHSVIDPVKKKAEEDATAGPTHLGQFVTQAWSGLRLQSAHRCRAGRRHDRLAAYRAIALRAKVAAGWNRHGLSQDP